MTDTTTEHKAAAEAANHWRRRASVAETLLASERALSAQLKREVDANIARADALAQERDAAFQRGMLHACDIACDVMQRAAKCAREPDLIPNIRREFFAQARGIEDAIDAIRRAAGDG